jgi:hypothetical protein
MLERPRNEKDVEREMAAALTAVHAHTQDYVFDAEVVFKANELRGIVIRSGEIPNNEAIKEMARRIVEAENKRNNRIDVRILKWMKKKFRRLLGNGSY